MILRTTREKVGQRQTTLQCKKPVSSLAGFLFLSCGEVTLRRNLAPLEQNEIISVD
jgi:hypothetical protein